MNLNGKNFKPFRYDDDTDTSFETLEMYFSSEKYINVGDATYTSTVIGGKTAFMGQLYQFPNSNGTNVLPQILLDVDKETIWLQEPLTFTIGDRYGEFEITEISNNRIVMKNVESITINDKDTILDGWIKFDVSSTTAIPYSEKLP
jgi:hypothetical protein